MKHVNKSFRLPHQQYHTLKERVLHPFRARSFDTLHAIRDVSFEVAAGEFFGIVGRNGSGKSTLLKCLAGIYDIDEGELAINGRVSPFIELGVGFNPDLTARDNVIVNAIMLGLSRREATERFDDILAFAELEEFVDLKLKNYSSGMHVRLAFATAVQVDADILLIDEVLAVGDAAFQQKCFDEFGRLRSAGRTVLFVTHDMGSVQRYCDRVLLLDHGRVVDMDEPRSIARQYNELNFAPLRPQPRPTGREPRYAEPEPTGPKSPTVGQILNAWFESPVGETIVSTAAGRPCCVRMDVEFSALVEDPIFAITMQSEGGHFVFAANTVGANCATGRFEPGTIAGVRVQFENWLAPGRYRLIATAASGEGDGVFAAHMTNWIIVTADIAAGAMTDLPHTFEIERR